MPNALRWLLVPVSIAFGCWSGIPLALLLRSAADSFCPAELRISGMCHAPWFPAAETLSINTGAVVGACLTVLLSFAAAPHHKRAAATAAFVLGAIYAAGIASFIASAWPAAACAIAGGLAALAWSWRRARVGNAENHPR
jgi:hypothetical protein